MKPLLAFGVLFCLAIPALAQESPKSEIFAGYSYLRTDEGDIDLLQLTGVPGTATREGANPLGQKLSADDTAFAAGFGGGMDAHLGEKISVRFFQADYILTRLEDFQAGDRAQGALRISTGLVFR